MFLPTKFFQTARIGAPLDFLRSSCSGGHPRAALVLFVPRPSYRGDAAVEFETLTLRGKDRAQGDGLQEEPTNKGALAGFDNEVPKLRAIVEFGADRSEGRTTWWPVSLQQSIRQLSREQAIHCDRAGPRTIG